MINDLLSLFTARYKLKLLKIIEDVIRDIRLKYFAGSRKMNLLSRHQNKLKILFAACLQIGKCFQVKLLSTLLQKEMLL
jgi:hypothetical protein